jgi:hypothetical protein
MQLKDITHTSTLKALATYPEINIDDFDTIEELRKRILFVRKQKYRKVNAEYFRTYMRNRYRRDHPQKDGFCDLSTRG